jgi:DNA-binding LytR/AlgR family response regulator
MNAPLRVAIADDEPPALRRLTHALALEPDVALVGAASDGAAALQLIRTTPMDVMLIDILMPGLSGVEVLKAVDPAHAPAFVFVTAFSRYATEAFDLAAVDYLLKPVEFERLRQALDRARRRLGSKSAEARIAELEGLVAAMRGQAPSSPAPQYLRELWAPDRGDTVRLPVELIDWVQAERDYVRIHSRGRSFLLRKAIRDLQAELDPAEFVRVHRGALVRCDRVARVSRRPGGPATVVLKSGAEVPVARRQAAALARLIAR